MATTSSARSARWYEKNRKAVLKRRRRKYRKDAEFRQREIERAKQRYWAERPKIVARILKRNIEPVYTYVPPMYDGEHNSYGHLDVGYSTRDVAKLFKKTQRAITGWIANGTIPAPLYPAVEHRSILLYSEAEFEVIREHSALLAYPYLTLKASVFAKSIRRDISKLRRGLLVQQDHRSPLEQAMPAVATRRKKVTSRGVKRGSKKGARQAKLFTGDLHFSRKDAIMIGQMAEHLDDTAIPSAVSGDGYARYSKLVRKFRRFAKSAVKK